MSDFKYVERPHVYKIAKIAYSQLQALPCAFMTCTTRLEVLIYRDVQCWSEKKQSVQSHQRMKRNHLGQFNYSLILPLLYNLYL
jgi:hypothetical protein